jgi:outer membrane protein OmpA-like peptidoglycan-associated protein
LRVDVWNTGASLTKGEQIMMKSGTTFGLPVLVLGSALGISAFAQTSTPPTQTTDQDKAAASSSSAMNPNDNSTYATGKPLQGQSKEGFWGHLNPLARKKWVNRQTSPIKDQVNELDQLQSKNANDIKDVDTRSQAGIKNALNAANTADQHAQDASNRANSANQLASNASSRTDALGNTVGNLDQYQTVSSTSVKFAPGRTALGPTAKSDLDALATTLAGEKGYIIEVQGYSKSGVQTSQAMADSVVRYLVTEHQVPVYRIYRSGLGKNTTAAADGEQAVVNGVRVTLLHNSLATMGGNSASNGVAPKTSPTGASSPRQVSNQ